MDPTDWLPFYPDQLPKRRALVGPALASQPPYNIEIFPVPDLLAALTFFPSFPDQVPRHRVPRSESTVTTAAIFTAAVAPLAWLPTFPDRVPHRRMRLGSHLSCVAAPPGQQVLIGTSLEWLPSWPSQVPHRRSLQPAGAPPYIAPLNTVSAGLCGVELGLETCASPALITQIVVTPGLVSEGLGSPAFIDEDLC
jgi:hypothetical protein